MAQWQEVGWNGCKLWSACGGKRCKGSDVDDKGRSRFRTPCWLPREKPPGVHAVDRRISGCPLSECEPWMWGALHHWHHWTTFGGLPAPGPLSEQPARLLDALAILEGESNLYGMYRQELAMSRSKSRGR